MLKRTLPIALSVVALLAALLFFARRGEDPASGAEASVQPATPSKGPDDGPLATPPEVSAAD